MLPNSNYVPVHFGKEAIAFSKERGQWLLANVDQSIGWPQKKVVVVYRDCKVLLLPSSKKVHASAAIITKDHSLKKGKVFLMQFLSALAWAEQGKIEIVRWTNSSTQGVLDKHLRLPLVRQSGITSVFFRPTELPNPEKPEVQLALALFREGLSLNHLGYSFLSYYKIINLKYSKMDKQIAFIKRSLPLIENTHHLKDVFKKLKTEHKELEPYIYNACRCAVAHASIKEKTYNPESIGDEIRFYEVGPIAHQLAKLIIEKEFKVKDKSSILQDHLYELEGFHKMLGKDVSEKLKAGEVVLAKDIKLKKLSLRIWNKRKFKAFENLKPIVISIKNGVVMLKLTRDGKVQISLSLDFPREKLLFDPMKGADLSDDNSKNAALQFADSYRFYGEIIANGVLEIWNTEEDAILGHLLEYLPVNILPEQTRENLILQEKKWREKAKKRTA